MIPIVRVQPDPRLLQQAHQSMLENGVVQLGALYPPALLAALHQEYLQGYGRVVARETPGRLLSLGVKRLHVTLQARGAFLNPAFFAHPFLFVLCQLLLGDEFIIATIASSTSFPGAPGQHPHRDQELLFHEPQVNALCPPASICLAVPLVPLDARIGATDFALKSHRDATIMDRIAEGEAAGFAAPEVPLGDALLWDNRIVHRGMANHSESRRPMLLVYIQRPWFRNCNLDGDAGLQVAIEDLDKIEPQFRHMFAWRHFPRRMEYSTRESVSRLSACPCGSGEKYKSCCGAYVS